ncbi:MAG: Flp pilus assembly protein CpaB [Candidatus Omnitrophica bacterium]|nr:Flp pilus assembly protein CpaB [Candidatus Omnitrophota bacterium]
MDKKKISLIVAVVMGLAAIILVNKYLQQVEQEKTKASVEVTRAVIATKRIPAGTAIDRTMVELRKIPLEFTQPGALDSVEAALGKKAVIDIAANEQVLSSKFSDAISKGPGSTLAMKTPFGKRAITISMDELSAVGGMIRPGDYVDIIGNFPFPQMMDGKVETQIATVMLFQNVLVLAVGAQIDQESLDKGSARSGASTVTLALTPKEAELITYAQQQGQLKLVLRSPLDSTVESVPIASMDTLLQFIFSQQGIDLSAVKSEDTQQVPIERQESQPIEIYRGGKGK